MNEVEVEKWKSAEVKFQSLSQFNHFHTLTTFTL